MNTGPPQGSNAQLSSKRKCQANLPWTKATISLYKEGKKPDLTGDTILMLSKEFMRIEVHPEYMAVWGLCYGHQKNREREEQLHDTFNCVNFISSV